VSTIYLFVTPGLRRSGVALFKQSAMGGRTKNGSVVLGLSKGELHAAACVENEVPASDGLISASVGMAKAVRAWATSACNRKDGYRCIGGACAPEIIVFERVAEFDAVIGALAALTTFERVVGNDRLFTAWDGRSYGYEPEGWRSRYGDLTKKIARRLSPEERANIPRSPKWRASPIVLRVIALGLYHLGRLFDEKTKARR